MSLGNSQNSDEDFVFDECIKRGIVALGFVNKIDISDCKDDNDIHKKIDDENEKKKFDATALDRLKNKIKIGDLILISYGNTKIRAIARVTGEYEKIDDEIMEDFVQTRKVEWIFLPNEPFSYNKILNKKLSQMSIYKIKNNVKFDDLRELFNKDETKTSKKYILIIDEINRGNISKIFGELITLIEESKRIGNSEELRVALPYSGKKFDNGKGFGVPKNLYIIGTMNTADRSIALIDTALRRRFEFVEMMPKAGLLKDEKNEPLMIESVNLQELLKAMNERIEFLLDREHTIGHAYFIGVANLSDLRKAFKNKIIPLLQEYFYDDYEKIRAVLNDNGMITDKPKPKFNGEFSFIDDGKMVYQICKFDELYDEKFIEICKKIYE
ncbi:MAG: AAA family ATPase [Campylobacter sp.]|nr:AAA family ATPase [Campylobacter sp.]